mmetsp:Transcript_31025/g.103319  ORF Transcript_31025/g.103319 Transcript_31025/m.103319 type:complete len:278 (+) Transcript_31025:83-916(+)
MGSRRPPKPHGSCKAKHNHHQPRSNTTPNRAAGLLWEQRIAVPCCVEIHQVGWIAPTLPCEPLLKSRLLRHKAARDARWHPDEGLVPQRAESERGNSCIPLRKPPGAQASSLERTLDLCDEVQPVCSTLLELNPERLAAGALHGIEKLCGAIPGIMAENVQRDLSASHEVWRRNDQVDHLHGRRAASDQKQRCHQVPSLRNVVQLDGDMHFPIGAAVVALGLRDPILAQGTTAVQWWLEFQTLCILRPNLLMCHEVEDARGLRVNIGGHREAGTDST